MAPLQKQVELVLRGRQAMLFLLCFLSTLLQPAFCREADDRSRFLYADDPGATIILEYQLHNAPSKDYSGDERKKAEREQPGSEYDEEKYIKPYFLLPDNGPRVVQFYSPWSGLVHMILWLPTVYALGNIVNVSTLTCADCHRHCQFFKTKYISLAKEIDDRLSDNQPEINFHAVSCSVYHWVCMQNNVKEFPTIVAFEANSAVPQLLREKSINAESIAESLGVELSPITATEKNVKSNLWADKNDEIRPIDILGASLNGLARTRDAVYRDAALSFTHALKTEIFPRLPDGQASGPLDSMQQRVFSDWIDLLYWALPPTWILHTLINDIRNNIDSVMVSEENLLFMVEKHQDVVNGDSTRWSEQCSKSDDRAGYSCGLWSLFHIISIGVIERHRAVLGALDQVSTKFVAKTVRDYIEQFFGCEQCREYFVDMFDTCGFNHCRRFKQPQKLPSPESWTEFALWLWEIHNDVNIKIVEAQLKKEGGVDTPKQKLDRYNWPPTEECPTCRDSSGKWDKDVVLGHLKKGYWPGGVQNFRYVVLKKKDYNEEESRWVLSDLLENLFFLALSAAFVMWCTRKQYITVTGRHKKMDRDYHGV
ncbi:hypothetical protein ACHAWF_006133 [Thalassiosira exigua]